MKILSITLFASLLCFAQERHIDFTQVLSGVDGKPLQSPDAKNTKGLTLGEAAMAALVAPLEEDKGMAGAEKFKLEELARKVYNSKAAHLTVEDIALIKTRIGKAYGPLVVGPAWRLLDPEVKKAEEPKGTK